MGHGADMNMTSGQMAEDAKDMLICGARVVTPGRDLGVADVRIEAGRIAAVGPYASRGRARRNVRRRGAVQEARRRRLHVG